MTSEHASDEPPPRQPQALAPLPPPTGPSVVAGPLPQLNRQAPTSFDGYTRLARDLHEVLVDPKPSLWNRSPRRIVTPMAVGFAGLTALALIFHAAAIAQILVSVGLLASCALTVSNWYHAHRSS